MDINGSKLLESKDHVFFLVIMMCAKHYSAQDLWFWILTCLSICLSGTTDGKLFGHVDLCYMPRVGEIVTLNVN